MYPWSIHFNKRDSNKLEFSQSMKNRGLSELCTERVGDVCFEEKTQGTQVIVFKSMLYIIHNVNIM